MSISRNGARLGAGFMLTGCYVLTAHHCLDGAVSGTEDVEIEFEGGEVLTGRVLRRSPEADLALIDVPKADSGPVIPRVDHASPGQAWWNPYRPSLSHALLSGTIEAASAPYEFQAGGTVEAIQLRCVQDLGDYAGYSGSPIEGGLADGDSKLFGVLIEQYPQHYPDGPSPRPASSVLFAVTMSEVFRRFDCFDLGHLISLLPSSADGDTLERRKGSGKPPVQSDVQSNIAMADAKLEALEEWQKRGLLDEQSVTALKLRVIERHLLGDDAGEQS